MEYFHNRYGTLLRGAVLFTLVLTGGCLSGGGGSGGSGSGSGGFGTGSVNLSATQGSRTSSLIPVVTDPAPTVTRVNPEENSTGAVITTIVLAQFDREMDAASINASTFTVTGPSGDLRGNISCDISCQTASFEPTTGLDFEETYTATLSDAIRDSNGMRLKSDVVWTFETAPELVRASTDGDGKEVDEPSLRSATDASGRFVAFDSTADDLVIGDTNTVPDVFVKDVQTGEIERVSVNAAGEEARDGGSIRPAITPDARFVAFESKARNLVPGLGPALFPFHVYVKDRETGSVTLVSANDSGVPGNGDSIDASISDDGRYVVFQSNATNLVSGSPGRAAIQVYVKDLQEGTIEVASAVKRPNGQVEFGDANSTSPEISGNGEFVVFESSATNFGATGGGDTQVYRKDLVTDDLATVSETEGGLQGNGPSASASISRFGQFVAFETRATNLGSNGTVAQIVRKDMKTSSGSASGSVVVASANTSGARGNAPSLNPSISERGRYVAFQSTANLIVTNNGSAQIFVKDLQTGNSDGPIAQISQNAQGAQGELGDSVRAAISRDGGYVAFDSAATNLVSDDSNVVNDVFRGFNGTFSR